MKAKYSDRTQDGEREGGEERARDQKRVQGKFRG